MPMIAVDIKATDRASEQDTRCDRAGWIDA
jgi:hypothetical protein